MIVVELTGGLGNQMFQYAIGRVLAIKNHDALCVDTHSYENIPEGDTVRAYELDVFRLHPVKVSNNIIRYFSPRKWQIILTNLIGISWGSTSKIVTEASHHFDPAVLNLEGDLYLRGYWQNEKYFAQYRQTLLRDFKPRQRLSAKIQLVIKKMMRENSVSVHIRRGDYVSNQSARKFHGVLPISYYRDAYEYIKTKVKNPHFYIFSDDIEWAKKNIAFDKNISHISHTVTTSNWQDLILMVACKHHIIANSSFSWWGAWLATNLRGITIAPKKWALNKSLMDSDIVPDRWVRV